MEYKTYKKIYIPNRSFNPDIRLPLALQHWFKQARETPLPYHKKKWNLSPDLRKALEDTKNSKELIIVPTDKNLGPAILTQQQYEHLALNHLLDENIYSEKHIDIKVLRNRIVNFHKLLTTRHPHLKKEATILCHDIDNTKFAKFKLLPKIHKRNKANEWNHAIRPLVAAVGSPTYGLSKYLDFHLIPMVLQDPICLRDSSALLSEIRSLAVSPDISMKTLDAQSLYTSIPLDNALNVMKQLTKGHPLQSILLEGLSIIFFNNYFTFKHRIFLQRRGVAMGTPVAPTVANLYLLFYEKTLLASSSLWTRNILLFRRFIDDLLIFWRGTQREWDQITQLLSAQKGIKWIETASGSSVDFLDLKICIEAESLITRTYQKNLNLYLYPVFSSAVPPHNKTGLIKGLLTKYWEQNTLKTDFLLICRKLKERLLARGYPAKLIDFAYQKFVTEKLEPKSRRSKNSSPLFFKVQYDPREPCRSELKRILNFDRLESLLNELHLPPPTICYTKNPNLRDLLCYKNQLQDTPDL